MKQTAFFILFSLGSFISQSLLAYQPACEQQHCIAVVDVGSTGSRLNVYSFDRNNTRTPIGITKRWSNKMTPGFANVEPSQAAINSYLSALFANAPQAKLAVYFYATAGMRLLSPLKQEQLFSYTKTWFSEHPNWQLKAARVISGDQEALYDWLTVNYQLGILESQHDKPVGVMDVGGASVQIAIPLTNYTEENNSHYQTVNLYNRTFKLFTQSFLGLGQTEVAHQFLDVSACFVNNYHLPTDELGSGNAYECKNDISLLVNTVHEVNNKIASIKANNPVDAWYSMGGVNQLVKSQPYVFSDTSFDNQTLLAQATNVCQQSWDILSNQYKNNDYLYEYCLLPAYYYALMVEGYGIDPRQKINYLADDKSNDWTLGVVLLH